MKAYIEKIIVEGFKSYGKERKEIPLGRGFISIVGPNGAGKSNIGDAISFALGIATTKTLRAKNLSYLIFAKDSERADHAYVEVHFKNEGAFPVEDEEIVISRKVTRDGRSTFKINGKTVRERDLKDFLSKAGIYENGYNVVLQGDIIKFLKMTPTERRKVIEDIAGISEYEAKKQKAMNDLLEVDVKIRELKFLLDEIKLQLDKLKEERDKLIRYKELTEEKRKTEHALLSKEISKQEKERATLEEKIKELEAKERELKDKIEKGEEELSQRERRLKEINEELLPFRERIGKISSDIDHIEKEIGETRQRSAKLEEEREKISKALEYLKKDLSNLERELSELEERLQQEEVILKELKEEEERLYTQLKELDDKLKVSIEEAQRTEEKEKALKEHIEKLKEEENSARVRLREIELKREKTLEDIERLSQEKEKLKEEAENSTGEMEKIRRMKAVETDALSQIKGRIKKLEEELKETRRKIEETIKAKAYVESKLSSLPPAENIFEGIEGVYGTVGDLITVKDPEHIRAVEVAGGGRLRYVVVENEEVARRCIEHLKRNNLGRMSFIPLNRIRVEDKLPPYPRVRGAVDFAINLVEYDKRFERAVKFAFGDTLIVEDFESAKRIGIGSYRMVTLEGELFEKSGIITGGSQRSGGELGRKFYLEELSKLEEEHNQLKEREEDILAKLKVLRSELAEREGLVKHLERKLSELADLAKGGKERLKEYDEKISRAQEYLKVLEEEEKKLKEKLRELKEEIDYSQEKLHNLSLKRQDIMNYYKSSGIEDLRQKYERSKAKVEEKRKQVESLRSLLGDKRSEIRSIEEEVRRKTLDLQRVEEEIGNLRERERELIKKKEELEEQVKQIEAQGYKLYKERDALEKEIGDLQAQLGRLRFEEEEVKTELSQYRANLSRVLQKLEDLYQRLRELGYEKPAEDVKEGTLKLKERLFKIERELENLGNVNLRAEEDYQEELARYNDYQEKHRKLQEERQAIKQMIEEIETKKLKAFMEAFNNINRNLKRIFSFLSPGGKAQMIIEDETDPFSGGINLIVKPRGKDVQYLEAMSGGEKTLAALSLIFAIQEYKPSPFYYFDEVDAHLDEANARKVGELIREKSKEAQFIVVTLREVLASFADKLIGVSARGGISRVFPVENLSAMLQQQEKAS